MNLHYQDTTGHPFLWIFNGLETLIDEFLMNEQISSNKYLVEVEKIYLKSNMIDPIFLRGQNRFFFMLPNLRSSIHSCQLPDPSIARSKIAKSIVDDAKLKFNNQSLETYSLQDYKIMKLLGSGNNLFCILKDSDSRLYVAKIPIYANGFLNEKMDISELQLENITLTDLEFNIFETNIFEFAIIVSSCISGRIFQGRFHSKKRLAIKFTEIISIQDGSYGAICLYRSPTDDSENAPLNEKDQYTGIEIAILMNSQASIQIFAQNTSNGKFTLERTIPTNASNYHKIEYFYTQTNEISGYRSPKFLEFLILFAENEIDFINLRLGATRPLIGQGTASIDEYLDAGYNTSNLNRYRIQMDKSFAVSDTGIFFGTEDQMYVLLSNRMRKIFFENTKQSNHSPHDLDQS